MPEIETLPVESTTSKAASQFGEFIEVPQVKEQYVDETDKKLEEVRSRLEQAIRNPVDRIVHAVAPDKSKQSAAQAEELRLKAHRNAIENEHIRAKARSSATIRENEQRSSRMRELNATPVSSIDFRKANYIQPQQSLESAVQQTEYARQERIDWEKKKAEQDEEKRKEGKKRQRQVRQEEQKKARAQSENRYQQYVASIRPANEGSVAEAVQDVQRAQEDLIHTRNQRELDAYIRAQKDAFAEWWNVHSAETEAVKKILLDKARADNKGKPLSQTAIQTIELYINRISEHLEVPQQFDFILNDIYNLDIDIIELKSYDPVQAAQVEVFFQGLKHIVEQVKDGKVYTKRDYLGKSVDQLIDEGVPFIPSGGPLDSNNYKVVDVYHPSFRSNRDSQERTITAQCTFRKIKDGERIEASTPSIAQQPEKRQISPELNLIKARQEYEEALKVWNSANKPESLLTTVPLNLKQSQLRTAVEAKKQVYREAQQVLVEKWWEENEELVDTVVDLHNKYDIRDKDAYPQITYKQLQSMSLDPDRRLELLDIMYQIEQNLKRASSNEQKEVSKLVNSLFGAIETVENGKIYTPQDLEGKTANELWALHIPIDYPPGIYDSKDSKAQKVTQLVFVPHNPEITNYQPVTVDFRKKVLYNETYARGEAFIPDIALSDIIPPEELQKKYQDFLTQHLASILTQLRDYDLEEVIYSNNLDGKFTDEEINSGSVTAERLCRELFLKSIEEEVEVKLYANLVHNHRISPQLKTAYESYKSASRREPKIEDAVRKFYENLARYHAHTEQNPRHERIAKNERALWEKQYRRDVASKVLNEFTIIAIGAKDFVDAMSVEETLDLGVFQLAEEMEEILNNSEAEEESEHVESESEVV